MAKISHIIPGVITTEAVATISHIIHRVLVTNSKNIKTATTSMIEVLVEIREVPMAHTMLAAAKTSATKVITTRITRYRQEQLPEIKCTATFKMILEVEANTRRTRVRVPTPTTTTMKVNQQNIILTVRISMDRLRSIHRNIQQ